MAKIETIEQLRKIYKPAVGRAAEKVLYGLEKYSRQFIELSPFLVISSMGTDGVADISPRGEKPGFVKILDDKTVAIPDRPGNNRIDTFTNILSNHGSGTSRQTKCNTHNNKIEWHNIAKSRNSRSSYFTPKKICVY